MGLKFHTHHKTRPRLTRRSCLYYEQLYTPPWFLIPAIIVIATFGYEIRLALRFTTWSWLVYVPLTALAAWILFLLSATVIAVDAQGVLYAGKAHINHTFLDRTFIVTAEMKSAALGRQLDPRAFVLHRSWVKTMALLTLNDSHDPTPYWMISTRHPDQLIGVIESLPPNSLEDSL